MTRMFSVFIVALALCGLAPAQEATIIKVAKETNLEPSKALSQMPARMPKFLDDDARCGESYSVMWIAPSPGLAPGVAVLFEYILQATPERQALHVQYDFKTLGPRKIVFTIPEKAYREGGNVKAWRVRIVRAGRLLAEQSSPDWKATAEPALGARRGKTGSSTTVLTSGCFSVACPPLLAG